LQSFAFIPSKPPAYQLEYIRFLFRQCETFQDPHGRIHFFRSSERKPFLAKNSAKARRMMLLSLQHDAEAMLTKMFMSDLVSRNAIC
jgi:hypothetical protein